MIGSVALSLIAVQQGLHWEALGKANEQASICAVQNAVRLDDRMTSPDLLARAAIAACYNEITALDEAISQNAAIEMPTVPFAQREPLVQEMAGKTRKRIEDLTIQAVLEQRIKHAPNQ